MRWSIIFTPSLSITRSRSRSRSFPFFLFRFLRPVSSVLFKNIVFLLFFQFSGTSILAFSLLFLVLRCLHLFTRKLLQNPSPLFPRCASSERISVQCKLLTIDSLFTDFVSPCTRTDDRRAGGYIKADVECGFSRCYRCCSFRDCWCSFLDASFHLKNETNGKLNFSQSIFICNELNRYWSQSTNWKCISKIL